MLLKDEWLSGYFSHGAYRYMQPFKIQEFPKGFIFAKVPVSNTSTLNQLFDQKFKLIEIIANFVQKKSVMHSEIDVSNCRYASSDDKNQVLGIAKEAFTVSRFYQDTNIMKDKASQIKHDWVENYFHGNRGTNMIVYEKNKHVCGFILLINNIIDLIAVSPTYLRQGVASKMLAFANKEIGLLSAGTQLVNKASIQMYQKSGFCLEDSAFVLHKHME